MGQHPLNLALRFVLEVVALIAVGYWGWAGATGALRYVLAIGGPLLAAVLWATFRVPGDASASGEAPVPVPGWARLLLELALFGFATWGLYTSGATQAALIFGGVVVAHYAISYDRVAWLLRQ
jgi:hypothetical protein